MLLASLPSVLTMYSPKVRSFDLYDVESGISNPGRYARRFVARRARWISGALVAAGLVLLLSDFRLGPARHPQLRPLENGEHGRGTSTSDELKNIWVEGAEGAHHEKSTGWGWGFGSPLRLAGSTKPELAQKIEGVDHKGLLDFDSYIAPMHPDLSLLPSPSDLLSEVKLPAFLKPPETLPFPDTRLREIISQPPTEASGSTGSKTLPADAFSRTWVRPEIWDQPRGQMRRVQWEGFARGREGWESDEQRAVREERREAVKRGFAWAWQGYKTFAWGG